MRLKELVFRIRCGAWTPLSRSRPRRAVETHDRRADQQLQFMLQIFFHLEKFVRGNCSDLPPDRELRAIFGLHDRNVRRSGTIDNVLTGTAVCLIGSCYL